MKKIVACICSVLLSLTLLTGCVTFSVKAKLHSKAENVTMIEVYRLDKPVDWDREKKIWYKREPIDDNYEECQTVIYDYQPIAYVNEEDYADFIADGKALPFKVSWIVGAAVDPAWYYKGYVVRIISGEEEEMFCNQAGGYIAYCNEDIWQEFLKKYIGEAAFVNPE